MVLFYDCLPKHDSDAGTLAKGFEVTWTEFWIDLALSYEVQKINIG